MTAMWYFLLYEEALVLLWLKKTIYCTDYSNASTWNFIVCVKQTSKDRQGMM